jgi:hypothetical protein
LAEGTELTIPEIKFMIPSQKLVMIRIQYPQGELGKFCSLSSERRQHDHEDELRLHGLGRSRAFSIVKQP